MCLIFGVIVGIIFGSDAKIETTDGHPFWVVTDEPDLERAAREIADEFYHENVAPGMGGFWVEAKDLRIGDVFLGANGELSTLINAVRIEQDGGIAVFNFTVSKSFGLTKVQCDRKETITLASNHKSNNSNWFGL